MGAYSYVGARTHAIDALIHAGIESSPATQLACIAYRNDPSRPNSLIQRTNTPSPTLSLYSINQSRDFIHCCSSLPIQIPLSTAAHPTPPPLLDMRQPPASLLAGSIKLRSWPSAAAGPGS
jgi:hypothetical protein